MGFSDDDAACFASYWAVMLILRGPALHLHGRNADVARWRMGQVVSGGRFGPLLLLGFWSCIAVCVFPGQLLPWTLATTAMAIHQVALLPKGLGHSYLLVSSSDISFAASAIVALLTGNSLRAAVSSAAPACLEAYAVLMFFAACTCVSSSQPPTGRSQDIVPRSTRVYDVCVANGHRSARAVPAD